MTRGAARVGVLTYHHVTNEGALLQAYALVTRLQGLLPGDRVEVIDYRPLQAELRDIKSSFFALSSLRRLRHSVPGYLRLKRFVSRSLALSPRRLVTDRYEDALRFIGGAYDAVVVGSDEVWKIRDRAMARRFPNAYWLSPELACKKIAFAASANKTAYRTLPAAQRDWMAKALGSFDLLGVRDAHTWELLQWLGLASNGKAGRVPDPTFMLDVETAGLREVMARCGVDGHRPALGLVLSDDALSRVVARHFRARGFQVVALGSYNRHADVNLMGRLDPLDWAGAFGLLAGCVTERYHPTIFSIKAGTPFLTVDHFDHYADYSSKNHSLLEECGLLSDCYVNTHDEGFREEMVPERMERILERFDGAAARRTAQRKRDEGEAFLQRARTVIHG